MPTFAVHSAKLHKQVALCEAENDVFALDRATRQFKCMNLLDDDDAPILHNSPAVDNSELRHYGWYWMIGSRGGAAIPSTVILANSTMPPRAGGVIAAIVELLGDPGGTAIEIAAKLKQRFPDRDETGMASTVKTQVKRLVQTGKVKEIKSAKINGETRYWIEK